MSICSEQLSCFSKILPFCKPYEFVLCVNYKNYTHLLIRIVNHTEHDFKISGKMSENKVV